MMFAENTTGWNVRLFLRSHPTLYGIWHAYKYCVTQTFGSSWRIVTFFRKVWYAAVKLSPVFSS